MPNLTRQTQVIGRFAPSPTGALHLGSLLTAVASYCIAKHAQGQWLLRIEDIDTERCHSHYSKQILTDLERLGLHWDGEVRYQSEHLAHYHNLLDTKLNTLSYGCDCSRKSIQHYCQLHHCLATNYPRICTHKHLPRYHAVRLVLPDHCVLFYDQLQGIISGNPQRDHGDIVVRRRGRVNQPGMINYMLAVVIDDAIQGVNQVIRGLDILPLTIAQLVIADYLALPPITQYYHLPILVNEYGQKLSKQTLAEPIAPYPTSQLLQLVLKLLWQAPVDVDTPSTMLQQAVSQWDSQPLRGQQSVVTPPLTNLLPNWQAGAQ